jgi:TatD DNase family protein
VTRVVTIGTGLESCRAALALAEAHEEVFAVLGVDPHSAAGPDARRLDELRALLDHPKAVAVGETGLDTVRRNATPTEQRGLFDAQLELAAERALPVVVHNREADDETAEALAPFPGTVVLHCFSSPSFVDVAVERGYYVSFAGNVTYPNAGDLRVAAAAVPAGRLLAETDSPYLAPQPLRGERNEPANIVHTLGVLAEARGETVEQLAALTHANAAAAFGLP